MSRPRIAILGRFAKGSTANRKEAIVNSRRLLEMIWDAGGDPVMMLPVIESNWDERLIGISGILMPGGADVHPKFYGQEIQSDEVYGCDPEQDEVDISLIRYAIANKIPLLTICRGTQVANVALGGTLVQHMDAPHRDHMAPVTISKELGELGLTEGTVSASCFHHQILDRVADGIEPIAWAPEGHIEAVKYLNTGWAFGVQWHPEDNYKDDSPNFAIIKRFVAESSDFASSL